MKKAFYLLGLFVALSSVTFGQVQPDIAPVKSPDVTPVNASDANISDIQVYEGDPSTGVLQVTPAPNTSMTNLATKTPATAPKTSVKTSIKGCCGMNGEKHACCAGMSKADYKKWKKKKKASSAL